MKWRGLSPLAQWALGCCGFALGLVVLAWLRQGDRLAYAMAGLLATPVLICVIVLGVTLIAGVVGVKRVRRERDRHQRGLCHYCAYDLRGIASARCPECGKLVWRPRDPRTGELK